MNERMTQSQIENAYWDCLVRIANRRPTSYDGGSAFLKSRFEAREVLIECCGTWKRPPKKAVARLSQPQIQAEMNRLAKKHGLRRGKSRNA